MVIRPSTKDRPATIEFSKEDEEKGAKIRPDFFYNAPTCQQEIRSAKSQESRATSVWKSDASE